MVYAFSTPLYSATQTCLKTSLQFLNFSVLQYLICGLHNKPQMGEPPAYQKKRDPCYSELLAAALLTRTTHISIVDNHCCAQASIVHDRNKYLLVIRPYSHITSVYSYLSWHSQSFVLSPVHMFSRVHTLSASSVTETVKVDR